jgi:hypothetical protein
MHALPSSPRAAIKTPYLENGKFDLDAFDRMVEQQISSGVEGLIIGGTTGEGQLMGWDEHIMLIAHTVNQFGREIKVVGNTGSNSTREALHATEQVGVPVRVAGSGEVQGCFRTRIVIKLQLVGCLDNLFRLGCMEHGGRGGMPTSHREQVPPLHPRGTLFFLISTLPHMH